MPEFSSNVVWKFGQFQPNTIWAAQRMRNGERISAQQLEIQKVQLKKKILSNLAKRTDPFSLVRQSHDFFILDQKLISRIDNLRFDFSSESGYYGTQQQGTQTDQHPDWPGIAKKIDKLNKHIISSWKHCDTIISNLPHDQTPLGKKFQDHLNKLTSDVEILLVGNNVISVQKSNDQHGNNSVLYAIKYDDKSSQFEQKIEKDLSDLQNKSYSLSKYLVAFKRVNDSVDSVRFYELELRIEVLKITNQEKDLEIKLIVDDKGGLFEDAIGYDLKNDGELLDDYEFTAHSDYIQYPFKEAIVKKRRYMLHQSYSLVFQGGGAKGVAYVGAYQAIKQQKKGLNSVPISSVMGSSAGGIIALAVSTDIDPYEVQKICYKMGDIPTDYRIDRKYLLSPKGRFWNDEAGLDREQKLMIDRIIEVLSEYGVINRQSLKLLRTIINGLGKDKLALLFQKVVELLMAFNQSIGEIFDSRDLDTYKFNYLGLLLEGALMRGEAIYDIGAEALVKFMLKNQNNFVSQNYSKKLGNQHFEELDTFVKRFNQLSTATFEITVGQITPNLSQTRIVFTIINKVLLVFGRHLYRLTKQKESSLVLDQRFAINLLDCFQFDSVYGFHEVTPNQVSKELCQIIKVHHKIHPLSRDMNEQDISQKEKRLANIFSIIDHDKKISYEKLSQQLAEEYFLDSKNFKLKEAYKKMTLRQLISKIILKFDEQKRQDQEYEQHILQCKEFFNDKKFIRELAQVVTDTLNAQATTRDLPSIKNYIQYLEKFKDSVKKITLSTYYKLTKIELSCTSVDLDNQVLRFFNHKTTPNLPVCRAIQMTGSFPGGFKALAWKEEWGNYFIHYQNSRREVFLTGHEFTDGGMLANFPIKYFDNEFIRDSYFSHVINKNQTTKKHPFKTIMLGFGLEGLTPQNYFLSEEESNTINKVEIATEKAWIQLKTTFVKIIGQKGWREKIGLGFDVLKLIETFRSPKKDTVRWKKLPQNLIKDIPVLNFAFKLLNAYPRADRNLNKQCFKNQLHLTMMVVQTKNIIEKNEQQQLEIEAQMYKDQKRNIQVLTKPDKGWFGGFFNGWFRGRKIQQVERPQMLQQKIQEAVNKTLLSQQYYAEIEEYFTYVLERQKRISNQLSYDDKVAEKLKIKQTLIQIIMNRMKLQFTQQEIQWHTLQFISLRYGQINGEASTSDKQRINSLSIKKFQDQLQKNYYRIEEELPFEDFKKKIYEIELLVNFKEYDPRISQEQLRRKYQTKIESERQKFLDQKRQYIVNNLSEKNKKEYLNLPRFYITQNQKFLVQYIFLSKLKREHLKRGNEFLQMTSVKRLLKYYQKIALKDQVGINTYLTVKNLKAFYRRLFSSHNLRYENNDYTPENFLEKQSLLGYEQEELQLQIQLNDTNLIELAPQFDSNYYLTKQIRMNHIHSEHFYWKKSIIEKIEFSSLLWEAFSEENTRKEIRNQLFGLIMAYPEKYNMMLAEIINPESQMVLAQPFFQAIMNNQHLKRPILHTLFDRNGAYYSQNEHVLSKYNELFELFKNDKKKKLEKINREILNPPDRNSHPGYSLKIQSEYLSGLQSLISFKLLIKRITQAKSVDYNLKRADLSSGMGVETDRTYRQSFQTQIDKEKSQKSIVYDEMLGKVYRYQFTYDKFEGYLNQIIFLLDRYDQNHAFIFKVQKNQLNEHLINIKKKIKEETDKVNKMPIESIGMKDVKEIYTLQNNAIKDICRLIIQISSKIQDDQALLGSITKYQNLFASRVDLPQFKMIWGIHKDQFKQKKYSKAIFSCLNKQFSNTYLERIQDKKQQHIMLHLTLEGNDLSNYYYAYYYELLKKLKYRTNEKQEADFKPYNIEKNVDKLQIAAITTSSYHSVFGFLVALNYSNTQLKYEMTHIRQIAYQVQSKESVTDYFDSYQWNTSSTQYKEFWEYIKQEKYNVFRQLQKLANKSLPDNHLSLEFKKIKSLYEHQQQRIINQCQKILEQVSQQLKNIDEDIDPRYKALEISQKYAFNYTCNLKNQHQFSTISHDSYLFYEKLIRRVFEGYGSLLQAVITNTYTAQVKVKMSKLQAGFIFKGFIVKQLLTTFKIKEYVVKKLKQHNLRESITLSEFFSNSPAKILLSFTTINVHQKRLQFINKNTLPHMPVWAAIVSASCLPYFYRDFECPREWETGKTDSASFYDLLVDDFFKSDNAKYKKSKYISGNIISSLPLELITNSTILQKMFIYEKEPVPYLHIGYAFDVNQNIYKRQGYELKRNYLEVNLLQIPKLLKRLIKGSTPDPKFNQNCGKITQNHKNIIYGNNKSLSSRAMQIIGRAELPRYIDILMNSNDNFMLHVYWDKLIRLPIKIDTLNFSDIVDKPLGSRFGVNVASQKGKETIERSYEITKYFQLQQFRSEEERYKINLRVTIVQKEDAIYGKMANFAKVDILSHSKWNRNRYNNFLVQYSINHQNFNSQAKFAFDSEFLWNITDSVVVYLRFYFPRYAGVENFDLNSSILFSQLQLNIQDIVGNVPVKDSYDYAVKFNQPVDIGDLKDEFTLSSSEAIQPSKKNMIATGKDQIHPKLYMRKWMDKKELAINSYIHHSI